MDRFALWKAIQQGHIDVVASDHAPKEKKLNDPFFEAPFGSAQAETMLTIAYDEGVNRGRIHPCKLVQVLSENPAKIFGLYPRKVLKKGQTQISSFRSDGVTIQSQTSIRVFTILSTRKEVSGKTGFDYADGKVIVENGEMKAKPGRKLFHQDHESKMLDFHHRDTIENMKRKEAVIFPIGEVVRKRGDLPLLLCVVGTQFPDEGGNNGKLKERIFSMEISFAKRDRSRDEGCSEFEKELKKKGVIP
jgi:hypothetical protein